MVYTKLSVYALFEAHAMRREWYIHVWRIK